MSGDNIQSFSADGKPLLTRNLTGYDSELTNQNNAVMNRDSKNNTILVSAMNNGSVIAIAARSFQTQWIYTAPDCRRNKYTPALCGHRVILYVDPALAKCKRNAPGVSVVHCVTKSSECFLTVLSIDDGSVCADSHVVLPHQDYTSLNTKAFPAGKALEMPMIAASNGSVLTGIDAATGQVKYQTPMKHSGWFASGNSPKNDMLAIGSSSGACDAHCEARFSFFSIADGSLHVEKHLKFKQFVFSDINLTPFAWVPSTSSFGAVATTAWGEPANDLITVDAGDGSVNTTKFDYYSSYQALLNLGNQWLVGLGNDGVYGIPLMPNTSNGKKDFFMKMPTLTSNCHATEVLQIVPFADGSAGLLDFKWGRNCDNKNFNDAYLTVYTIPPA